MRTRLRKFVGRRLHCRATFQKYGLKNGCPGPTETVVVTAVTRVDTGEPLTDHVWLADAKAFRALGRLNEGDVLDFHATVAKYEKGYRGWNIEKLLKCPPGIDYWLIKPSEVRRVE